MGQTGRGCRDRTDRTGVKGQRRTTIHLTYSPHKTGSGRWCRTNQTALRTPSACRGCPPNWCPQDGIEPPSTHYKRVILPLNDAGIGVSVGGRSRTFAFAEQRARPVHHAHHSKSEARFHGCGFAPLHPHFVASRKRGRNLGGPMTNRTPCPGLQSGASPFGFRS